MSDPSVPVVCYPAPPPMQKPPSNTKKSGLRNLIAKHKPKARKIPQSSPLKHPTAGDIAQLLRSLNNLKVEVYLDPQEIPGDETSESMLIPGGTYTMRLAPRPERHGRPVGLGEFLDLKRRVEALEREDAQRKRMSATTSDARPTASGRSSTVYGEA